MKSGLNSARVTIAVLLLVIVILGSVALYYSPLLNGPRMTKQNTMPQLSSGGGQIDPVAIYAATNRSVVTVEGVAIDQTSFFPSYTSVLGTGFVITYSNSYYIVTNFHVMDGLMNATVTFSNGDAYPAKLVGSDAYSDLAVISVNAAASELHPLQLGVSSSLKVGESVVAIGNPYGLSGTITMGIVSQLGRSLPEGLTQYSVADTIQFSAQINPGNSGGPLLNGAGAVVGITTASAPLGNAPPVEIFIASPLTRARPGIVPIRMSPTT